MSNENENQNEKPSLLVYGGQLNWYSSAKDEAAMIIFPNGIAEGQPVTMYWKWTKTSGDEHDSPYHPSGTIQNVSGDDTLKTADIVHPGSTYYTYKISISESGRKLTLEMGTTQNPERTIPSYFTERGIVSYADYRAKKRNLQVYDGQITWGDIAQNEIVVFLCQEGITNGPFAELFWGWTNTGARGEPKGPTYHSGMIRVTRNEDGTSSFTTDNASSKLYYNFEGVKHGDQDDSPVTLTVGLEGKGKSSECSLKRSYHLDDF